MRAGGKFVSDFHRMVRTVEKTGHTALSELSKTMQWGTAGMAPTFGAHGDTSVPHKPDLEGDAYIYTRDIHWLGEADVMVAEVSGPSLGVGYEIAYAIHICNIPVLGLLNRSVGAYSAMLSGNTSPLYRTTLYSNAAEMEKTVVRFLDGAVASDSKAAEKRGIR